MLDALAKGIGKCLRNVAQATLRTIFSSLTSAPPPIHLPAFLLTPLPFPVLLLLLTFLLLLLLTFQAIRGLQRLGWGEAVW